MSAFFLLVELLTYLFAIYILLQKKEIAIIYLPVIIFAHNIIEPVIPASAYYLTVSFLVFSFIFWNPSYYRQNIPAFLLFLYFLILLPRSSDLVLIRPYIFATLWLFTVIPTVGVIYQKHPRKLIFNELINSAFLILSLFVANVVVSTLKGYSPYEMYGITSGILYGKLIAADFNILSIAVFVIALGFITNKKILNLAILVITFSVLMLTLRRSVMGMAFMGVAVAYLTLLTREKAKMFFLVVGATIMLGGIIYATTEVGASFQERYELRKLDERELEEEKRFFEYELLYKDMFVYRDYSPLIGFELFNSWGNYGRGILEERSLHGDLTSIVHSSGFIGLILYLLMVFSAFRSSYRLSETRNDYMIVLFCAMAFVAFTITGRYTEVGSMMLLYMTLLLPLAKEEDEEEIDDQPKIQRKSNAFKLPTKQVQPYTFSSRGMQTD